VSTDSNGGSNVMNPYNWRLDYGSANWDVRHRFVSSFSYELPFFANASQKIVKNVLGGWQFNGISTLQSGFPFSVTISADQANVGQGTQRANILSPTTGKLRRGSESELYSDFVVWPTRSLHVWQHGAEYLHWAGLGELRSVPVQEHRSHKTSEAAVSDRVL
jgi:hypothetical protein